VGVRRRRAGLTLLAAGAAMWALDRVVMRVEVVGDSMKPTLWPGDRVLAVRRLPVAIDDLAVVRDPRRPGRLLVKRVAAVSVGHVSVAGDNPGSSTDSRAFGAVARTAVLGRVVHVYSRAGRPRARDRRGVTSTTVSTDPLERVLDASYVTDLESLEMDELRARRDECQELETALSYVRRLAQGRLDIAGAELKRRTEGGEHLDVHELVSRLPDILSDRIHAPGLGRLPTLMAPGADADLTGDLDAVADATRLLHLADMADDEVTALVDAIHGYEHEVSARRRRLHEQIDKLQAEIIRRYRTGEASVESLLS
jgi:nickel-type superoxide dismutase maturation protease